MATMHFIDNDVHYKVYCNPKAASQYHFLYYLHNKVPFLHITFLLIVPIFVTCKNLVHKLLDLTPKKRIG